MRVMVVATGYDPDDDPTYTGRAVWTLVRDDSANIYRLLPEVSQLHVDCDGNILTPTDEENWFRCDVQRISREGVVMLDTLPENLELVAIPSFNGEYTQEQDISDNRKYPLFENVGGANDIMFQLYEGDRLLDRENVPVLRDGGRGQRGLPGLRVRLWKEIVEGQVYRNDEGIDEEVETGYVDFLAVRGTGIDSGYYVYQMKAGKKYTATASIPADAVFSLVTDIKSYLGNNIMEYWEAVDINVASGFFNFLIANHALIDILSNTQLLIRTPKNQVVGGMQGAVGDQPIFWAGAEKPEYAPVQIRAGVDASGKPFGYAIIEGQIIAGKKNGQRVELNPDSMAMEIYDAEGNPCSTFSGKEVDPSSLSDGEDMGGVQTNAERTITGAMDGTIIWLAAPTQSGIITLYFDTTLNATLYGEPPVGGEDQDIFELPYVEVSVEIRQGGVGVIRTETLILADNHTQTNVNYSDSTDRIISFRAEKGKAYTVTLTVNVSDTATINSGSKVVVSCETLANAYHSDFGKNGMLLSLNKANSFGVYEQDGKLIHMRNGVEQPYTLFAAQLNLGVDDEYYDMVALCGTDHIFNYAEGNAGSASFYIADSLANAPLIINATSLTHGCYACVHRVGSYIQIKNLSGGLFKAGEVYVEIKTF